MGVLQITSVSRCKCFVDGSVVLTCNKTAVYAADQGGSGWGTGGSVVEVGGLDVKDSRMG